MTRLRAASAAGLLFLGAAVSAPAAPAPAPSTLLKAEARARKGTDAGARHCVSLHAWNSTEPEISGGAAASSVSGTDTENAPS